MNETYTLNVGWEDAQRLVVACLKEDYRLTCKDIAEFKSLKISDSSDLNDVKKLRKSIKRLLRYYMTYADAEAFFNQEAL